MYEMPLSEADKQRTQEQILLPGSKLESLVHTENSVILLICSIDLSHIMWSIRDSHPYFGSETLIKYSEAIHSPVSTRPTEYIRLTNLSYFRNLEPEPGSEAIADKSEGIYIESSNTRGANSEIMKDIKKGIGPDSNKMTITLTHGIGGFGWLYCTSIDPNINYKRREQMKGISRRYNFMTKIEKPAEFAKHLGYRFAQQLRYNDEKHDLSVPPMVAYLVRCGLAQGNPTQGTYGSKKQSSVTDLICVYHGLVIYHKNKNELINNIPGEDKNRILPTVFVKPKDYKQQQEYRFLIHYPLHKPNQEFLDLKISDELRNLMSPIEWI